MSKEIYYKLTDKLGRPPTDEEVADAMADLINYALDRHYEDHPTCAGCMVPRDECGMCRSADYNFKYRSKARKAKCSHCGSDTEDYCIIETGPPGQNWIEGVWVRLGYEGKPVCSECYYK